MTNETMGEKVSVNMNASTLSCIDLLVDNCYYSNRSDFINQAVREAISKHQSTIDRLIEQNEKKNTNKKSWFFGICGITKSELEEFNILEKRINLTGYGVLVIDEDCPEEWLYKVYESIKIRGKVKCSENIRKHYGLKK